MFTKRVDVAKFSNETREYNPLANDVYLKLSPDAVVFDADKKRMVEYVYKPSYVYYQKKPYMYFIDSDKCEMLRIDLTNVADRDIERVLNGTLASNILHRTEPDYTTFQKVLCKTPSYDGIMNDQMHNLPGQIYNAGMTVNATVKPKQTPDIELRTNKSIQQIADSIIRVVPAEGVILPSETVKTLGVPQQKQQVRVDLTSKYLVGKEFESLRTLEQCVSYRDNLEDLFVTGHMLFEQGIALDEDGVRNSLEAKYYNDWASIVRPEDLKEVSVGNLVTKFNEGMIPKVPCTVVSIYLDEQRLAKERLQQANGSKNAAKSGKQTFVSFDERYAKLISETKSEIEEAKKAISEEKSVNSSMRSYDPNKNSSFVESIREPTFEEKMTAIQLLPPEIQRNELSKLLMDQKNLTEQNRNAIYFALGALQAASIQQQQSYPSPLSYSTPRAIPASQMLPKTTSESEISGRTAIDDEMFNFPSPPTVPVTQNIQPVSAPKVTEDDGFELTF